MKIKVLLSCILVSLLFSCKKDDKGNVEPNITTTEGFYVCCEGSWGNNNGSLFYYNLENRQHYNDIFKDKNGRGLGDTPVDLKIYGSKMYCVVNTSNTVEVMEATTAVSIKQIPLINEDGIGRQPRQIAFHNGKAYVCSFDGTVVRIDTTSLAVEASVKCGRNPDGICVANNKLYVSNSGGLGWPENYDNTVSVIDIESFSEIKRISVVINPGKILADSEGDVYVVSRGNYGDIPYTLQRIDSRTDETVQTFDNINALNFTICNDTAYLYSYDFTSSTSWIKSFDCKTEQIIRESFISDQTVIIMPYGINVNPLNGDVYITEAYDTQVTGDVYCFDRQGKQKFKIEDVGFSPNVTLFKYKD